MSAGLLGSYASFDRPNHQTSRRPETDQRNDVPTAHQIERALNIVKREGVGPALAFMEEVGVSRQIALRVLASPDHIRAQKRRASEVSNSTRVAFDDSMKR
jgi:hypothetical protein